MNKQYLALAYVLLLALFASTSFAADDTKGKLLYHVVCCKYKPDASREQIAQIEKGIKGLKDKIPGIRSVAAGTTHRPENLAKGFTHGFIVAFASETARDEYLPHPEP